MGFSGIVVVARADQPLTELAAIRACGGKPVWSGTDGSNDGSGAWQAVQITGVEDDPAPSLVTDTSAPTLVARVIDSDFAVVQATSPVGTSWIGVLGQDQAESYPLPEEFLVPPEEVVEPAVAWARETGRQPDSDRLEDVLQAEPEPTAESLVFDLLGALGFDFVTQDS